MKNIGKLLIAIIVCSFPSSILAMSGQGFLDNCDKAEVPYECTLRLEAFDAGVAHGITSLLYKRHPEMKSGHFEKYWNSHAPYCLPKDIATSQLTRVYIKYLKDNPESLHFPYGTLLVGAFEEAFPCY